MAYISKDTQGDEITLVIESTNIVKSIYNYKTQDLILTFKNGVRYKYPQVNEQVYTKFQEAESQGKAFHALIKSGTYEKLADREVDMDKINLMIENYGRRKEKK